MMPSDVQLEAKTREFAEEIARTVARFIDKDWQFHISLGERNVVVKESLDGKGFPLCVDGNPHLSMTVEYYCAWDSEGEYLAVDRSDFRVYPYGRTSKEALFRYDFVRNPQGGIPAAHVQVHAHRDEFTHVLSCAGRGSRRGRRLAERGPNEVPRLSAFHFPLGGPRFRPCLEDVLAALQDEFGLDVKPDGLSALDEGRERWRRQQTGAVVRDCPEEAVRVLGEMGYEFSTHGKSECNQAKLIQL